MSNLSATRKHIELMHDKASGIEGKMILASFGEGLAPIVMHFAVGKVSEMTQAAITLTQQANRNVYMPLALFRNDLPINAKGTEKDIVASLGLVADFDDGRGADYLERCPISPTYALETSPQNTQAFFFFDKPFEITADSDRLELKEIASNFTKSCTGADHCSSDLSHVWRIPGLLNYPNQKKLKAGRDPAPFEVKILQESFSNVLPVKAFSDLPKSISVKSEQVTQSEKLSQNLEFKKSIDLLTLKKEESPALVDLIVNGAAKGYRSEAAASVVWKLLKLGYGTGDIAVLFQSHPQGIGSKYEGSSSRIETEILRLSCKQSKPESSHLHCSKDYSLLPLTPFDEVNIPPRPWVLGNQLMRGQTTILIAPAGVGKSTVSLTWAMSVATGRPLFGLPVHEQAAVAVINNEDDMDELNRRIFALQKFHSVSSKDLESKFFVQSGDNQHFLIAKKDSFAHGITAFHKDSLTDFLIKNKIGVLFVDPFLETHEADENDNRQINEVARMYREISKKANCAICLIHHTRKQQGQSSQGHAGNADSGRGASSLVGAARIVTTLYDMSEADAKLYGISQDERHLYIRMDDAKANLSLKSGNALWYKKETVKLFNGDYVGVLREAFDIQNALAQKPASETEALLQAVGSHPAFADLRTKGLISREALIEALKKSNIYLGRKSTVRSTLQGRIDKLLLGKEIRGHGLVMFMKKISNAHLVHVEFEKSASLPSLPKSTPASLKSLANFTVSPVPAQSCRQF